MQRELKTIPVSRIHQSTILPLREHGTEISGSVRKMHVQTPLIVRAVQEKPDEYEVIDGSGRLQALRDDDEILVDIRSCDLKDSEVFAISNASFQRKERTAYEVSQFYAAWLKVLEKEKGPVEGLQQELADLANLSESSLCQFISIARLFNKLQEVAPKEQFSKLKMWSINKLYKLSELVDDDRLIDAARFFDMKFDTSIEEVGDAVASYRGVKHEDETTTDQQNSDSGQAESSESPLHIAMNFSAGPKNICLRNAKKVGSLAAETHDMLNGLVQELEQDVDRFSSAEVLQMLNRLLRTLKKLKKHSTDLKNRMKPPTWQGGSQ